MVLVIIKDAISFHLSKFQGQATALDAKIICKLLSLKRNIEFVGSKPLRFCGKIGHNLCACGTLSHMREFSAQLQIILSKFAEKISDHAAVM